MTDTVVSAPPPPGLDELLASTPTPGTEPAKAPQPENQTSEQSAEPPGLNEFLGIPSANPETRKPSALITGSPTEQMFNPGESTAMNAMPVDSKTGLEGIARGMSGGLSDVALKGARTLAEKYAEDPDQWAPKPEDVAARAKTPTGEIASGLGMAGSLMAGAGVPALIAGGTKALLGVTGIKALAAAEGAGVFTKLGAAALTGAIETGALTGSDKISKAMLGQKDGDPSAAASSALTDIGAAGLIGGLFGGAGEAAGLGLKGIANSKISNNISKNVADFGSRWNQIKQFSGDRVASLTDELSNYLGATNSATSEVYGLSGLKDSAVKALAPKEVTPALIEQVQGLDSTVASKLKDMASAPENYPKYLTDGFAKQVGDWQAAINDPNTAPYDVFNATQKLKQYTQTMAKYDFTVNQFHPGFKFKSDMSDLAHELKTSLEDSGVWGKAGDLQKGVNEAWSDFAGGKKSPLADFKKKFTSEVQGERVIDPTKVNTYLNQLGKPNAEIKQDIMDNFLNASDKFHQEVGKLHDALGVENSIVPPPTDFARLTANKDLSPGAKLADYLQNHGLEKLGAGAVQGVTSGVAGTVGSMVAGPFGMATGLLAGQQAGKAITPLVERIIGPAAKNMSENSIAAVLRVISSGNPTDMTGALNYAKSVTRGQNMLNNATSSLFKTGAKAVSDEINDRDKKKLMDYITNGGAMQEAKEDLKPQAEQQGSTPAFAKGGEVNPKTIKTIQKTKEPTALEQHFPEQNMILNTAKGRISNYLGSLRPSDTPSKLPFDKAMPNVQQNRAYDNALHIALNPVSVVNRIKDGTLTVEHMKHLTQMYPEIHKQLSQKITEGITHTQMDEDRVPYKTRQMMSLFLGAPLDSTMTPQSIMAAQSTYKPIGQKPQDQAPDKPMKGRKGKSAIDKEPAEYTTPAQAGQKRASGAKD